MNRIKSAALTVVGMCFALVVFGFFATVGLALLGGLMVIGVVTALAVRISAVFASKESETPVAA